MKNILCYGDSNTYGFIAGSGGRYDKNKRWTRLLGKQLGEAYDVIEEGLNGRTTIFEDSIKKYIKGIDFLEVCMASHKPIELVILMLGTNDLKVAYQADPPRIAEGLECLVKLLRNPLVYDKDILIVSPIHIRESIINSEYRESFGGASAVGASKKLAAEYRKVAKNYNCYFLDAATYAEADDTDAIHLGEKGHVQLAKALYDKVIEIERFNDMSI